MRITILGSGYVGLVSGACFADLGYTVHCIDRDRTKISALAAGHVPIFEPGLAELVAKNAAAGRLVFSTDLAQAAQGAEIIFLAVGTPPRKGDGHADMSYVHGAARELAPHLQAGTVVVIKSTVPVGTGDRVARIIAETNASLRNVSVVSNPEFLREGAAIGDFLNPDRIIVGTEDARAAGRMAALYAPLTAKGAPLRLTSRRTSELIKYTANAFLAMKISFINEIADLCEQVGANVEDVADGIGLDPRIGRRFLNAGPGHGGSCFPKDTLALIKTAEDAGSPLRIVETVAAANETRKRAMGRKIAAACGGSVDGRTIAVLGLTFKPNTDDMREAPSIAIIQALQDGGAHIRAYDPEGMTNARAVFGGVVFSASAEDCLKGCDAMVLVTEWDEFRALSPQSIKALLKAPIVVDLRNVYNPAAMRAAGLSYTSVGRP